MGQAYHILVLEDETATRCMLCALLETEGFHVTSVESGAAAYEVVAQTRFDLIILDLNLPDEDGLHIARELRARSDVGIVMLTSRRDDIDRVIGLEMGADDYITKPFFPRELVVRVKNLLRRLNMPRAARRMEGPPGSEIRHFDGWEMHLTKRSLVNPKGEEVNLTRAEFDLLTALVNSAGRVLSREQLLDAIGSQYWTPVDRTIDVLISRLRRKMEADPKMPTMILTSHGYGYKFVPAVKVG